MSPELSRPLRSKPQALRDIVARAPELYFLLQEDRLGVSCMEREPIVSRKQLVKDIAEGQHEGWVAVLYGAVGERLEDVTDDIMRDVADYRLNVMPVEWQ